MLVRNLAAEDYEGDAEMRRNWDMATMAQQLVRMRRQEPFQACRVYDKTG